MSVSRQTLWWLCLLLSLTPLLGLAIKISYNDLGANRIETIHIYLGDWALRFLCLTLVITPIQIISRWRGLADFRQLLGLYAWLYASLHLFVYLVVDHQWQWAMILTDIWESPYIWLGLLSYIILFLLGITTSKFAKKALAGNWKKLHRFIYIAVIAALIHYIWQLKGNLAEPLVYGLIIGFLFLVRMANWYKKRQLSRLMIPLGRREKSE